MYDQQSGSSRLREIKINAITVTVQRHEQQLLKTQKQLTRIAGYLKAKRPLQYSENKQRLAKAMVCGRIVIEDGKDKYGVVTETSQASDRFRWVYACRQVQWCSRCASIERETRARMFAESVNSRDLGRYAYSLVISSKRPSCVQEVIDKTELLADLIKEFRIRIGRSKTLGTGKFAIGIHTQPQPGSLLWPHLHAMFSADVKDTLKVRKVVQNWLDKLGVTHHTVALRRLGRVGVTFTDKDLKHFYRYITRVDDKNDDINHPAVRQAAFDAAGISKPFTNSRNIATTKRKRSGFPNATCLRSKRLMLSAPVSVGACQFYEDDSVSAAAAASHLQQQALTHLEQNFGG